MTAEQPRKRPGGGKPAKPVSEFGQIANGTTRCKILTMMSNQKDGKTVGNSVADIAESTGLNPVRVVQHAYCLWRDIGIGYRLTSTNHLMAIYPVGKSFTDAIKEGSVRARGTNHRPISRR